MKLASFYLRSPADGMQPQFKRIAPAIIGAVGALGSAALNYGLNRQMMNYKLDDAKDLMSYEWQNFQSPKAQVRALSAAGISPSVAFSSGGVGQFATPKPTMPTDSPFFVSGVDQFANAVSAIAQAKKAGAETIGKQLENKVLESSLQDRIEEVGIRNNWTKEQTSKTTQEFALISGQCNEMQQRIDNMRSEKALTDKQINNFDRRMSAEIENLRSSAEYHKAMAGLTESQKELFDSTMDNMKSIVYWQEQQLEKLVGLLGKYGDAQAVVGMISQVVGAASDIIGSITPKGWFNPTGKK